MTMKQVRMWVDPAFKRRIKQIANDQDKKVLQLTREIAQDDQLIEKVKPKKQQREDSFGPVF